MLPVIFHKYDFFKLSMLLSIMFEYSAIIFKDFKFKKLLNLYRIDLWKSYLKKSLMEEIFLLSYI